jgi:CRP-like cAMP-binding protein
MGYLGPGNVFGDADIISKRSYMFSLRVKKEGSSLYLLKSDVFFKFFGQFKENFRAI